MINPSQARALLAPLCIAVLATAMLGAHRDDRAVRPALPCPTGYAPGEVHVIGQRFEAGLVGAGDTPQVIVQHDLATSPQVNNYVVILACVRPWNAYEQAQANAGLGTRQTNYPFTLPNLGASK